MTTPRPSRSIVYSRNGMVVSASPLAASVGINVLLDGGNAFDAAIAVAATETVTMPSKCSLGGEAFAVMYQASTGKVIGITSSGAAPTGATPAFYQSKGHQFIPRIGPLSITVPGEVQALEDIHRRFCTVPFQKLLEPSIAYAEEGFPITPVIGTEFELNAESIAQTPSAAAIFLNGDRPYRGGDVLVQKDLAKSLKKVAEGGADEFYRGSLAKDMVKSLKDAGATFTEEDFANHKLEIQAEPLNGTYRGNTIYESSPPSQGFLLLAMLNILEGFDLASMGHNTAESIHLMVEAKKLAYADRNTHAGDPWFSDWPLEKLLSKEHASRQRELIDPTRAATEVGPPLAVPADGNTAYIAIADSEGNCVSFIHSVFKSFGSEFVADGTGILFNNRMTGFRVEDGHANSVAPGKRAMHTLNCYLVFKDGVSVLIGGSPGADQQPQANCQMLTGLIDFELGLQEVVDAPRWSSTPGTNPSTMERPYDLQLEDEMPEATVKGLEGKGHKIGWSKADIFGRVNLLALDHQRGIMAGASDPRADGHAVGM